VRFGFLSERPVNRKDPYGKRGCLLKTVAGARCAMDYAESTSLRAHQLRQGAMPRDGSRYSSKGNSERTTPAGWPTYRRRAPSIVSLAVRIRIEFTHSLELPSFSPLHRPAPQAPRRLRYQNLPRPRPSARKGAMAAASPGVKTRGWRALPLLHLCRDKGGSGQKW
jgi:hypothetical protein